MKIGKWEKVLRSLTWGELEEWAGEKIVSRGRSYKKHVSDVAVTPEDEFIAWVQGTRKYATWIELDSKGGLDCGCTCPYERGPCKHAVALVLVCMDLIEEKAKIPKAAKDDERLRLYYRYYGEDPEGGDWDDDDDDDDWISLSDLGASLKKMKKQEIVDMLLDMAANSEDFHITISDRILLQTRGPKAAASVLRRQIDDIIAFDDYDAYWSGNYSEPDFTEVQASMKAMIKNGQAGQVLSPGLVLWENSDNLIESLDQDGEIGMEIGECMDLVFEALFLSSMKSQDRLLWLIERFMEDQYDVLPDEEESLCKGGFSPQDWAHAADLLRDRLSSMPAPAKNGSYFQNHERSELLSWLIRAMEESGREGVIELLMAEAPRTGDYERLVRALLEAGDLEQAKQWAIKGFEGSIEDAPRTAWAMVEMMQTIAARLGDKKQVAALAALAFFDSPRLGNFLNVEKAVAKEQWPETRLGLMSFLESGRRPDLPDTKVKAMVAWPLPAPWVSRLSPKRWKESYPLHAVLIKIAVHEKRHDDAIARYLKLTGSARPWGLGMELANAVWKTHPDFSINQWKAAAEHQISQVKVSAYKSAGEYLRKVKKAYESAGETAEWKAYAKTLRDVNRRRPRMIEVLNSLEKKPIMKS
ncbi:SWIM zinc finger family protein [Desulfatibacillum aliphaticivorans]|uniref:SWIM zinc finger family protein n=1 Tax=Desulfatibacillum aliphaticivorans TaxID=218208 RepID=UPI00041900AE|nr:SWIM zinc finger family protein [Desulfatibacillum aliphaticivorans]